MVSKTFIPIKKLKPKKLFIAADGPRESVSGEYEICKLTREIVLNQIDWECEVKTLFREKNMGVGVAIKSALEWFFENVEEGIIIEDDCLVHPDFFQYCNLLLTKFRNNEKVFCISGTSIDNKNIQSNQYDYYFTRVTNVWGWATWRRSFKKYDFYLDGLDNFKQERKIEKIYKKTQYRKFWINFFEELKNKKINNWDYQLAFTAFANDGLCARPKYNLVTNLGTRFLSYGTNKCLMHTNGLKIEVHPPEISPDEIADDYIMKLHVSKIYFLKKILKSLKIFNSIKKLIKRN